MNPCPYSSPYSKRTPALTSTAGGSLVAEDSSSLIVAFSSNSRASSSGRSRQNEALSFRSSRSLHSDDRSVLGSLPFLRSLANPLFSGLSGNASFSDESSLRSLNLGQPL